MFQRIHIHLIFWLMVLCLVGCSVTFEDECDVLEEAGYQHVEHKGAGWGMGYSDRCPDPQPAATTIDRTPFIEAFEAEKEQGFEGYALVLLDWRSILGEGAGTIDQPNDPTPTIHTAFDIGTIAREFTVLALHQHMSEDPDITLDSRLDELDSSLSRPWDRVRIRDVLYHQSGLDSTHSTDDFEPISREEAQDRITSQSPIFEAGDRTQDSGSGYTLLASLLEHASDTEFQSLIQRNILTPYGMDETGFYGESTGALLYAVANDTDGNPLDWPNATWATLGNTGLLSTPNDVAGWMYQIYGRGRGGRDHAYGYLEDRFGGPIQPRVDTYTSRTSQGYNTAVLYVPEYEFLVIVMTHRGSRGEAERCARALFDAAFKPREDEDGGE